MAVNILLLEPHDHVNAAFKRAISGTKYTVVQEVTSGEEVIEILKTSKTKPDLVVMDMVFPGMGGIRTLEEGLKVDPKLKVVMIYDKKSGYLAVQSQKKGAMTNIRYPFKSKEHLLEQLAIAEAGGADAVLGSDEHFARLTKPLALTVKKRGLLSFLSGEKSALSEKLSVKELVMISDFPYKEGSLLDVQIHFKTSREDVEVKVTSCNKSGESFEVGCVYQGVGRKKRENLRKGIIASVTSA